MATQAFDSAKELALALTEHERAELARELVASLDGPSDSDATDQWEAEILRRVGQIDQGTAEFLTPDEVRAQIRRRLHELDA